MNSILHTLKEEKEMRYKGGLYHRTQILMAYNTNRIEGSRLTQDQTRSIFETNTVFANGDEAIRIDDIVETQNHFRAFDFMLDHAEDDLSENIIKTFHQILKQGTSDSRISWFNVGDYKMLPNEAGLLETSEPDDVPKSMQQLLSEYLAKQDIKIEDIIDFHAKFEKIHPFQDGNGRVGRLIMFKECLHHNITPFIIDMNLQPYYYRGLWNYQTSQEKGYLVDTCLTAQDRYSAICSRLVPKQRMADQLATAQEKASAEHTPDRSHPERSDNPVL